MADVDPSAARDTQKVGPFAAIAAALALAASAGILGHAVARHQDRAARAFEDARNRAAPALPLDLTARGAAAPGSMVPLADGWVLRALADDQLALLRFDAPDPAGHRFGQLSLERVFVVRNDPGRYLLDPAARSPHGYYLDDVGAERAASLARDQAAFGEIATRQSIDAAENARLEVLGRQILAQGDATTLIQALEMPGYAARRAAGLVLGEAGFMAAAPALIEALGEEGEVGERARAALAKLAGRSLATRPDAERWWNALPARARFAGPARLGE